MRFSSAAFSELKVASWSSKVDAAVDDDGEREVAALVAMILGVFAIAFLVACRLDDAGCCFCV